MNDLWLFKSHYADGDLDAVRRVLSRGTWWANGPEVTQFENAVTERSGHTWGVAFNSGTSALYAVLDALAIDGEVIVPSFTFPATVNAVELAGGTPVFADVERDTFGLDAGDVRRKLTDDTSAIVVMHFAGDVARDSHDLAEIAQTYGLVLIEDAAHTLWTNGAGTYGRAAMFSFAFNKLLTTGGEGGMVVCDNADLATRLRRLRSHGKDADGRCVSPGHNLRMTSMQAAVGLSQLERFDELVAERRRLARYYDVRLGDVDAITLPASEQSACQLYNVLLPIRQVRDGLQTYLKERGVPTRVTYRPVHREPYYRRYGADLPVTDEVAGRILTLPLYPGLTEMQQEQVIDAICEYVVTRQKSVVIDNATRTR